MSNTPNTKRPVVVREKAVEHRAKASHNTMIEVLPHWFSAPYSERFKLAARLLPLQTLLGNLALIAWLLFIALAWAGHITVK
ncbi:MAG: hypothetical protein Rubg2KO_15410 [Rubricoccaceae bacterium]